MTSGDSVRTDAGQLPHGVAGTILAVESHEERLDSSDGLTFGVISNISINLLSIFLRKHAVECGRHLSVISGSYDDGLTDSSRFAAESLDAVLYWPFFDNLIPSFEDQIPLLSDVEIDAILERFLHQLRLILRNLEDVPWVFVAGFHMFNSILDRREVRLTESVLDRFNVALREEISNYPNTRLMNTDAILRRLGFNQAFDPRFYRMKLAPYSIAFLDEFARRVSVMTRGFGRHYYKALILDCDNTLWGGILGEELLDGIQLDPHSYPGRVFWQAQIVFKALERNGVLLCLCTKNNAKDVLEVFEHHPHSVLREGDFAVLKVNWVDKAANIREIANELNVGLDSLVFLDDSAFECDAVRTILPEVKVFQVPSVLSDYRSMVAEISDLFLGGGASEESKAKTRQYQQARWAAISRAEFASTEDYLASLGLRVDIRRDDESAINRISELSQKSNQFNLTTVRMAPSEVRSLMRDPHHTVYSISVADRFGSAGLTGVVIVGWNPGVATMHSLMLSCRVLGRGIEFSFWRVIVQDAEHRGVGAVRARYIQTRRNEQVSGYYDAVGLTCTKFEDGVKDYEGPVTTVSPPHTEWIGVFLDE